MELSALYSLAPDQRALIDAELQPGETITWAGQPKPRLFTLQTIPLFLFAVPWTAFAIFWVVMAYRGTSKSVASGPGQFFPLFGMPFIFIGLWMFSAPIWMKRRMRRTIYLITNRRAIIFQRGFAVTTHSFMPEQLKSFTKRIRSDGSGDIVFTGTLPMVNRNSGNIALVQNGFYAVANVKEAEGALLKLAGNS